MNLFEIFEEGFRVAPDWIFIVYVILLILLVCGGFIIIFQERIKMLISNLKR